MEKKAKALIKMLVKMVVM